VSPETFVFMIFFHYIYLILIYILHTYTPRHKHGHNTDRQRKTHTNKHLSFILVINHLLFELLNLGESIGSFLLFLHHLFLKLIGARHRTENSPVSVLLIAIESSCVKDLYACCKDGLRIQVEYHIQHEILYSHSGFNPECESRILISVIHIMSTSPCPPLQHRPLSADCELRSEDACFHQLLLAPPADDAWVNVPPSFSLWSHPLTGSYLHTNTRIVIGDTQSTRVDNTPLGDLGAVGCDQTAQEEVPRAFPLPVLPRVSRPSTSSPDPE